MADARIPTAKEATAHIKNLLVQRLRDAAIDNNRIVSYEELSELVGFKVNSPNGRYYTEVARDILLQDYGVYYWAIKNVGFASTSAEKAALTIGETARQKIRSQTKKWRHRHGCIKLEDVKRFSQEELQEYLQEGLKLALQEQMISEDLEKRLEDAAKRQVASNQPMTQESQFLALKSTLLAMYGQS